MRGRANVSRRSSPLPEHQDADALGHRVLPRRHCPVAAFAVLSLPSFLPSFLLFALPLVSGVCAAGAEVWVFDATLRIHFPCACTSTPHHHQVAAVASYGYVRDPELRPSRREESVPSSALRASQSLPVGAGARAVCASPRADSFPKSTNIQARSSFRPRGWSVLEHRHHRSWIRRCTPPVRHTMYSSLHSRSLHRVRLLLPVAVPASAPKPKQAGKHQPSPAPVPVAPPVPPVRSAPELPSEPAPVLLERASTTSATARACARSSRGKKSRRQKHEPQKAELHTPPTQALETQRQTPKRAQTKQPILPPEPIPKNPVEKKEEARVDEERRSKSTQQALQAVFIDSDHDEGNQLGASEPEEFEHQGEVLIIPFKFLRLSRRFFCFLS